MHGPSPYDLHRYDLPEGRQQPHPLRTLHFVHIKQQPAEILDGDCVRLGAAQQQER
jgi:hypothetical protein